MNVLEDFINESARRHSIEVEFDNVRTGEIHELTEDVLEGRSPIMHPYREKEIVAVWPGDIYEDRLGPFYLFSPKFAREAYEKSKDGENLAILALKSAFPDE